MKTVIAGIAFILFAIGMVGIAGCGSSSTANNGTQVEPAVVASSGAAHLTDTSFNDEITGGSGLALVDFNAKWCGPCRKMGPVVDDLARELPQTKVAKVDVDACPNTSNAFNIHGIPCLVLFKDGKEVSRTLGYHSKEDMKNWIHEQIGGVAQN